MVEYEALILQRIDPELPRKWYHKGFRNEDGWRDIKGRSQKRIRCGL